MTTPLVGTRSRAALSGLVAAAVLSAGTGRADEPARATWDVDEAESRLVVHVYKEGLLKGFAHDHHFVPRSWSAQAIFDPARPDQAQVRVVVEASSFVDEQPDLSEDDRRKVERQISSAEILDAGRYPQIRFEAARFEPTAPAGNEAGILRGTLAGSLTLHGTTRPLRVSVAARVSSDRMRVNGTVSFAQSAFGIEPYSTALGTIAVQDRVRVDFSLVARPAH